MGKTLFSLTYPPELLQKITEYVSEDDKKKLLMTSKGFRGHVLYCDPQFRAKQIRNTFFKREAKIRDFYEQQHVEPLGWVYILAFLTLAMGLGLLKAAKLLETAEFSKTNIFISGCLISGLGVCLMITAALPTLDFYIELQSNRRKYEFFKTQPNIAGDLTEFKEWHREIK